LCVGVERFRPPAPPQPVIVIDDREKQPYAFPGAVTRHLAAGDYSILGYEDRVAIERKSKKDAYRSLGHVRERFQREIERLANYDYAAIVIESSLPEFLIPPPFGELHPHAAIASLLGWSVKYRLPVLFAGDRAHAESTTRHLLESYAWYAQGMMKGGQGTKRATGRCA
jgi:DNA excision repair protein ERCC-4